ncbi:MAG: flagellar biosynthesis protein FlhB [Deltaproteobacteria bacterium]|nr:flagellar biosynthesis protein FlhB [Deltaproteobacteria bacterium]
MADNDQERTEQATSRRREQANQEGNYASSKEVSTLFMVGAGVLVLYFSGTYMFSGLADVMRKCFHVYKGELTVAELHTIFKDLSFSFLMIIAPALLIPILGALSYVLQNGINFTAKPLAPDFKKINPISGFKKIVSLNALAELVKSILKISILTYVVFVNVKKEWVNMPMLIDMEVAASAVYIAKVSFTIMVKTVWVLVVIAVLDYAYQRWNFEKGLRMSKEEIKEEMKETEGDPIIKARIKSMQREMARKRMMADVPKADVVVTNPTHIAVAIRYDREKGNAPIVVAKGAGHVAEKIREIARKHGVPVLENKPLARTLHKTVKIGMEIPADLYKAVAEVLAYVYRLKQKRK